VIVTSACATAGAARKAAMTASASFIGDGEPVPGCRRPRSRSRLQALR
jgi:hypothetical protein